MHTGLKLGGLMAAMLVAAGAAAPPAKAGTFGSTTFVTARDCSAVTAADPCDGTGPGQHIFASSSDGGIGLTSHASLSVTGGTASGSVGFVGGLDLPVIHGASSATGDVRMNSNNMGWQSYDYAGSGSSPLSFVGSLNIDNSSTDGSTGALPNGAIYSAYVAIWDPSILAGLTSPVDLFDNLYGNLCGTPGVLAAGYATGPLPGGAQTYSVTTHGCGGVDPFVINPGQSVYAVAGMQIPANRGGFVDASHTFTVALDPSLGAGVIQDLTQNLIPASVPEPSTWAMMLLGLGAMGLALRRRSRATVPAR